jgi:hypothetical protein
MAMILNSTMYGLGLISYRSRCPEEPRDVDYTSREFAHFCNPRARKLCTFLNTLYPTRRPALPRTKIICSAQTHSERGR